VALVHPVTTTHLDMGTRPDANAAFDSPALDSLAKVLGERHIGPHPVATGRPSFSPTLDGPRRVSGGSAGSFRESPGSQHI
jgi:hypothetical protein